MRTVRRAGPRHPLRTATGSILAACLILACDPGSGGKPVPYPVINCAELSDSLFPVAQRSGLAAFKVAAPDGGSYKVGTEMRVIVSGVDYTSALVDLVVFGPAGGRGRLPGFPAREGIKPRETCEFRFAVPESLTTLQGKRISLVSDSVKVLISDYTDPQSLDYSDAFFSVTR